MTCHMKSASFSATNQLVALFDGGPTKITQVFSTTSVSPTPAVYKKFKHSKNVSCYTEPRYSFIPNSIQKLEIFQTKRQSQIKSYLQQTFYFKPHTSYGPSLPGCIPPRFELGLIFFSYNNDVFSHFQSCIQATCLP